MKRVILVLLVACMVTQAHAQFKELTRAYTVLSNTYYTTNDFNVCGAPGTITFKVRYIHCPNGPGNCISGCGSNPVRYTIKLYRGSTVVSQQTFQASSSWSNTFFYNVSSPAGNYRAHVKVERRKSFCIGWETLHSGFTNTIVGNQSPATPNFNVNGATVPADGSPINVCISNIKINAASTSCEDAYYLGVQESNRWWSRTYDYEWGRWYSGQAPNNINLQTQSVLNSQPPYYTGDPNRQNTVLLGGNLPSGEARYYRVSVCTGIPSWNCKTALIRVNPNCRINPEDLIEDTNEYVWIDNPELEAELLLKEADATIETSFEAKQDAFDLKESPTVTVMPNPFSSVTTIKIQNYTDEQPVLFELYNTLGECVQRLELLNGQVELNRGDLAAGVYLYRAVANDELLGSGKLVVE